MIITRELIRELSAFRDVGHCAVSFYFQPGTPRDKAHRESEILIKDLVRDAQHKMNGSTGSRERKSVQVDLDRIFHLAGDLRSNGTHAKLVFACSAANLWRELDVPARLLRTQLFIDRYFHLRPMSSLLDAFPKLGIVLVDRHRARIFDLQGDELTEREGLFQSLSRKGRSDGYLGYDGGRAERRVEDEVRQHYKTIADTLQHGLDKGAFDKWILGCQGFHYTQLESQLHPYVRQAFLGRFHGDPGHTSREEILTEAHRILRESQDHRCRELTNQALSDARGNAHAVTGLRRVLRSLELGEVQTLLIAENFQAHAVECSGCGHLDAHIVGFCPVCGKVTRHVDDVVEAIFARVMQRDIEVHYIKGSPEFDQVGNIAALLRFRSDRNTNVQSIAAATATQALVEGRLYPGRLRRFAGR